MKKPTLGQQVFYTPPAVTPAPGTTLDDSSVRGLLAAAKQSVYPATITRVIDDKTVDLELQGAPVGTDKLRAAVALGKSGESNTWHFDAAAAEPESEAEAAEKKK